MKKLKQSRKSKKKDFINQKNSLRKGCVINIHIMQENTSSNINNMADKISKVLSEKFKLNIVFCGMDTACGCPRLSFKRKINLLN